MQTFNEKYKKDFNSALDIYENNYSHEKLLVFLQNGTVAERQAAALMLDEIKTQKDAKIFMQNLTGCDGKIREAVSFRLQEFVKKTPDLFNSYAEIFLDAIIDINGNICRNTINALKYLKSDEKFCENFCKQLVLRSYELSEVVKDFDIQDGKYKVNKKIFKLYWYLETIYEFVQYIDEFVLIKILRNTKNVEDYTIREKTAKILSELEGDEAEQIRLQLKVDKNYYVRRF